MTQTESLEDWQKPDYGQHDDGPWYIAKEDGSLIFSDDFTHDVQITIFGDFASDEQRRAYAENIVAKLNRPMPDNQNAQIIEGICDVTGEKSLRKNKGEINPCQCKTCNAVRVYPCDKCGVLRSQDEGGTVFTVCDECWDKK